MQARLILEDGSEFRGELFGSNRSAAGEIVFNTGMVGYPETLTDPSYHGQLLVLTYPLIGNYGVPTNDAGKPTVRPFESDRIQAAGLIVSELCENYSHWEANRSLNEWMQAERVPGIQGIDTRALTQRLRTHGSMLAKLIVENENVPFYNPNNENLVAQVSPSSAVTHDIVNTKIQPSNGATRRVALIDCGSKRSILTSLLNRSVSVTSVPWDWSPGGEVEFDGYLISNGPGDPTRCPETVATIRKLIEGTKPILGICLGHQILARAAGAETYKLKFGHRSQNQPCVEVGTKRCYITSQNHGYAVQEESLPQDWAPWFFNANDGTNEGIRHRSRSFFGVQFHPEAAPGPIDTSFVFDQFVSCL